MNIVRKLFENYQQVSYDNKKLIRAGVLIPLVEKKDELYVILTKRTDTVEYHKGQISFPGGSMDVNDKSIIDTALRESEEEIGIVRDDIEVLGVLRDFYSVTGFCITPVVGLLSDLPKFSVNKREVAEVFDLPLSFFIKSDNLHSELNNLQSQKNNRFSYIYGKYEIWGITAKIIKSFVKELKDSA